MDKHSNQGQSLILLAISLTSLLGFVALTVDVGRWYVARQKAVNVCDMAALGAATEMGVDATSAQRTQRAALEIVDANNQAGRTVNVNHFVGQANPDVIISYYNDTTATNSTLTQNINWTDSLGNPIPRPAPGRGLLVRGKVNVPPLIGKVLGYGDARDIPAHTIIALGETSSIIATMLPFGVSKNQIVDIEHAPSATVEQVLTYRAWQASWSGAPGAFGTLAPGGQGDTGGSDLQYNITWGHPGSFYIGQYVATTDGSKTGALQMGMGDRLMRSQFATIQDWLNAFNSSDPDLHSQAMTDARLVMFPIIDENTIVFNGYGTAESVEIVGFATYAISTWNNGTKQASGYFVKSAYEGSIGNSGTQGFGTLTFHML
ncbi:MAG TPA: Tad domain-containing protein [Armatimonadota bacterium]|nr:Tad domain-containing protein [Armatimonadota bacterium]